MRQARTCGRRRAEVGQWARAAVTPQSFANNRVCVQTLCKSDFSVQNSGQDGLLKLLSVLNVSLFRQNIIFQSNYISVLVTFNQSGPNLGGLGMDKNQKMNEDFNGSKSHTFDFI